MTIDEYFEIVRHTTNPSCPICTPIDGYPITANIILTNVNQVIVHEVGEPYEDQA